MWLNTFLCSVQNHQIKYIWFIRSILKHMVYLDGPYYTGPKLTPAPSTLALIGVIFQMLTVKLS